MGNLRKAIIFDGEKWHVRRIRVIEHDLTRDEKVYRCDKPISNDHTSLSEVPEVKKLLRLAVDFQQPRIRRLERLLREAIKRGALQPELLNLHDELALLRRAGGKGRA